MQVIPLASVTADAIKDALGEEVQNWRQHLHWDYEPAARIIRRHVTNRTLPGFCLELDSTVVGYCYFVVNPPVGYLGNIYVRTAFARSECYRLLVRQALDSLRSNPDVSRIESQVFGFNADLVDVFTSEGMEALLRHFMTRPLDEPVPVDPVPADSKRFKIVAWDRRYFLPAADVIHRSYRASPDHRMCYDYQSREGCVRFLRNLVDNPGCGIFDPSTTRVALDGDGRACGVIITSIIGPRTGMIPQISIRPSHQGQGIGTALLRSYFEAARKSGLDSTTLSVSDANQGAFRLYARLGFRRTFDFHAFVWNRGD